VQILGIATDNSQADDIVFSWQKLDARSYSAAPVLLNPGDSSTVVVVSTAPNERVLLAEELSAPTWSVKIAGGDLIMMTSAQFVSAFTNMLGVLIYHQGVEVFLLVIVGLILNWLLIGLAGACGSRLSWQSSLPLSCLSVLAFSTAEVFVDLVGPRGLDQSTWATVVLLCFALTTGVLSAKGISRKQKGDSARSDSHSPPLS
jgi:hypothetical protein